MPADSTTRSMAKERFETFDQALDRAINLLTEHFDKPDQQAAVQLANSLYTLQERERFNRRGDETAADVPYQI